MPGFYPLKTQDYACDAGPAATTHNLSTALAALSGGASPSGGSYGEVYLLISNSGSASAFLACAADLAAGDTPTNLVIPAGTTTSAPKQFGPFKWNGSGLPLLRLLAGAACRVTFMVGAS